MNLQFENPIWFWLLLVIPVWILIRLLYFGNKQPALIYGTLTPLKTQRKTIWVWIALSLPWLVMVAFLLLVTALARPQLVNTERVINSEGVDIVLTLDISGSMRATDLNPNRLAAARDVARDFVAGREADRIGLVVFAGEAYTQVPLTLDYQMLKDMIKTTTFDDQNPGTAIGMALAASINRLRESEAKTRIIILLTDGRNNQGSIDPVTAADLALSLGIRVYTVGVGRLGQAEIPVTDQFGRTVMVKQEVDVDDETLTKVATLTGGKYYRATDNTSLRNIYTEIGQLEKTKIEVKTFNQYEDVYWWFLLPALLLLFADWGLTQTRLRQAAIVTKRSHE